MTDYAQAWAFIAALAGDPTTAIIDWRCLHDTDNSDKGHARRGTLPEWWSWLCDMNAQGYGVFANVAAMDGKGRELANVWYIRAHYVDLDSLSAQQNYEQASRWQPAPSFAVQSSPGKYHVYWAVNPYQGNDRFQVVQRKLRQLFDGDKVVIDATRVMRVPGLYHMKIPTAPHMVAIWSLNGYGQPIAPETLEQALAGVNVIDGGIGTRHELGEPSLAAPSIDWIKYALSLADPNNLDRGEWIAMTAAIKQAGWTLTDETTLHDIWSEWCAQYDANDVGENEKQWRSIRNSELGWPSVVNRIPSLKAMIHLGQPSGGQQPSIPATPSGSPMPAATPGDTPAMPPPPALDCKGEMLTDVEQRQWFAGCVFVVNLGEMLTGESRFLNTGQFNVAYGGKKFIIDSIGKTTNEAWAAATRSTLWQVPKVDHIRFVPTRPYGETIIDDLGRKGINTYKAINVRRQAGDVSPFLNHIGALLPDGNDQRILLDYLAHNAKYPGHKIPWAPVIQSTEGAGKGVMKLIMSHVMGRNYTYFPNAKQLSASGATFNAWMRNKLFILADEIKVDDRLDLIEVLKPMISEETIEIQAKGVDQDLEDNFSNWLFFTNYKNAIPVSKNGRRYSIFFSPLQSASDLIDRGMNEQYFTALYDWLKGDGAAIVADYLLNYPIDKGAVPMRAPETSSSVEAVKMSRGPIERIIAEAIEDNLPGFRGGWVSMTMIAKRVKDHGHRVVQSSTLETILSAMGYFPIGRAPRPFIQEDQAVRPYLFHIDQRADVAHYGRWQGWE